MTITRAQNPEQRPNPLLEMARQLLFAEGQQYSEHALLKIAVARGLVPEDFGSSPKRLFQAHFALLNGLYRLQPELAEQQLYLEIGLAQVRVRPLQGRTDSKAVDCGRDCQLREYYLDWQHFDRATEAGVNELLKDFWQRLGRQPVAKADLARALEVMELTEPVTWAEVKRRYRRLAMRHHPDRGGDEAQLQQVHWAMAILERAVKC